MMGVLGKARLSASHELPARAIDASSGLMCAVHYYGSWQISRRRKNSTAKFHQTVAKWRRRVRGT